VPVVRFAAGAAAKRNHYGVQETPQLRAALPQTGVKAKAAEAAKKPQTGHTETRQRKTPR
jgi:hypothetical protein